MKANLDKAGKKDISEDQKQRLKAKARQRNGWKEKGRSKSEWLKLG